MFKGTMAAIATECMIDMRRNNIQVIAGKMVEED